MTTIKEPLETATQDIPFGRPWIDDSDRQAVLDVLDGHVLTHGPRCKLFEEKFSQFIGGGFSLTTSSCMAALHLSALYLDLRPGDEVLVPAQTHVATVHAIELLHARPIFVDCEIDTGNMNLALLEKLITSKTKAIFLVHFAGIPMEMDRVCEIAAKHQLAIVEDCALAVGSTYKNKHVGLWGDIGCFSFYPAKHLTTAEGGMLVTKNEKIAAKIARLRAFGVDRHFTERNIPGFYDVNMLGLNYRMSELQAALGCTQLDKIDENLKRRKQNFTTLKNALLTIPGISHILDSQLPEAQNSYYCLILILKPFLQVKRNVIIEKLTARKVGCSIYYPQPVPRMTYYATQYQLPKEDYKNASLMSDGSIALPVGPHLNEDHMYFIANNIAEIIHDIGVSS